MPRSPVTKWILASPFRTNTLLKLGDLLGYGSPKQVAGRRSKMIYKVCSEVALGHEKAFWYDCKHVFSNNNDALFDVLA